MKIPQNLGTLSDSRDPKWRTIRLAVWGAIVVGLIAILLNHLTEDQITHVGVWVVGLDWKELAIGAALLGSGGGLEAVRRYVTKK